MARHLSKVSRTEHWLDVLTPIVMIIGVVAMAITVILGGAFTYHLITRLAGACH
jgi:hypothetical protein